MARIGSSLTTTMGLRSVWGWLAILSLARTLAAPAPPSREYETKAVLLLNLARFVEWPDSAFKASDSPLVIGILGQDPFGSTLDEAVAGEQVNGRKIVIERLPRGGVIRPCHLLFVCNNERPRVERTLAALKGQPVLTVSELEGFATSLGGMIRIYTNAQNKVRLQVDLQAARAEKLRVSSKLLQVAEVTRK
jgi:hypothetical protein